jgi:hypothetical protein
VYGKEEDTVKEGVIVKQEYTFVSESMEAERDIVQESSSA